MNALKSGESRVAHIVKPGAWEKFKLKMWTIKDSIDVYFNIVSFHGKMLRCLHGTLAADHTGMPGPWEEFTFLTERVNEFKIFNLHFKTFLKIEGNKITCTEKDQNKATIWTSPPAFSVF